ncbi:MAG: helix-turn-helix transcriptional regulator [bacterium]|nr:helix-turn-helix transcriptional regulator [bacterium]
MLKTKPIMELFGRGEAAVVRRIRRDRRRASEELRAVFDHIEARFYDIDLTLDSMERQGVVDWHLRERFREERGLAIKPYLLQLKQELASWLLWKTPFRVKHIAELLGYSRPFNFSRDFCRWTGQSPEDFSATRRAHLTTTGALDRRTERRAATRERICSRLGLELPRVGERGLPAVAPGALFVSLAGTYAEDIAQLLWEIVREETPGRQPQLLRHKILFNGPELFQLLSRLSRDLGRRSRRRGVDLAELALATANPEKCMAPERRHHRSSPTSAG